jgi:hypothetical protein
MVFFDIANLQSLAQRLGVVVENHTFRPRHRICGVRLEFLFKWQQMR